MKTKLLKILVPLLLFVAFCSANAVLASANSTIVPIRDDLTSELMFLEMEDVKITSQVLDIKINDSIADFKSTYKIKSISDKSISVKTGFFAATCDNGFDLQVSFLKNDKQLEFEQIYVGLTSGNKEKRIYQAQTEISIFEDIDFFEYIIPYDPDLGNIYFNPNHPFFTNMYLTQAASKYIISHSSKTEIKLFGVDNIKFYNAEQEEIFVQKTYFGDFKECILRYLSEKEPAIPEKYLIHARNLYLHEIKEANNIHNRLPFIPAYKLVVFLFDIDIEPNEEFTLSLIYNSSCENNFEHRTIDYTFFQNEYWADYSDITVLVTSKTPYNYKLSSNLAFKKEKNRWIYKADTIPEDGYFHISLYTKAYFSCFNKCMSA